MPLLSFLFRVDSDAPLFSQSLRYAAQTSMRAGRFVASCFLASFNINIVLRHVP